MDFEYHQLLYGGDYNPDQWLDCPEILQEDIRLMKKAHVNTVSLGIFSWAKLEPEENVYDFDWMAEIIDRLYANGISVNLATPSGARPHWLADRYPEVLRVDDMRRRQVFGVRHNHCFTSPVYRKKVHDINAALAKRFDSHPGVRMWHISNEYGGECHCPLCQQAFRDWLKERYQTIEEVNRRWNTMFWSHTYQSFEQIESPSPAGEWSIQGLTLDWKRFVSYQTIDFCRAEIQALRDGGAKKPATTNMMYYFQDVNYFEMAKELDLVSWDNYPSWHKDAEHVTAMDTGMMHDIMRSLKKKPFLLMESCPGPTNWQPVSKLKRPGMLEAASLQAIAHGSDSVLYFQIRQGRGGFEKFHGAMISHYGGEDDRTYRECCQVGEGLEKLAEVLHAETKASVAVIYDWENRWALEGSMGPRNQGMHYKEAVQKSYSAFRRQGLDVDVIDMTRPLEEYRIVAAPMLYLFRAGFEEKARKFVENGGVLILTYWSGVVDENDLCVLGGTPGGLMDVAGLRSTEIDALYDGEKNTLEPVLSENGSRTYECGILCQLVETTTAKTLFTYGQDFYAGTPALTVNSFGAGQAYYVCADAEQDFYTDLYEKIVEKAGIERPYAGRLPEGVEVTGRSNENGDYLFIQNFQPHPVEFAVSKDGWEPIFGEQTGAMRPFSTIVLKRNLKEI